MGHFFHFNIAPTLIIKIYYQRRGSGFSPSSTSSVSFEFCSLIIHPCTILASTCINFLLSWFWQVHLTFNSHLWILHGLATKLPPWFISWELGITPWVCILLQICESMRLFALVPFDKLKGVSMDVGLKNALSKQMCKNVLLKCWHG